MLQFASRLRRPLAALFCVQIVLGGAGATVAPAGVVAVHMPRNAPNFQAPAATDCARPARRQEISTVQIAEHREPADRSGFIGSTIDSLRDLDPASGERTLTLVDGRRMVSSSTAADVVDAVGDKELSEVTVTGTRIQVAGAAVANPITSITAEEMRRLGIVNVADALTTLVPQNLSTYTPGMVAGGAAATTRQQMTVPVTAGMVDDNADFSEYLNFRSRTQVHHRPVDISMRHLLQVRDTRGAVIPDAEVIVHAPGGSTLWARTDAGGRVWVHPLAFDQSQGQMYEVTARKNGRQGTAYLRRNQKSAVDVVIRDPGARPARARLDLVFLIDATGSMGDEIAKLKSTLRTIADEVAQLPSQPDTCFGLVAYRDRTDSFVVRSEDFTNDLGGFQGVLDALQAGGGGDYAEAMNEALAETVHRLSWRGADTTRLVVLLADAPPHLDYNSPQYDDSMVAALGKGIKVFSVGASGLDKQGEYIQRQIAQYTGGKFVFLTYQNAANPASGPGRETRHDVSNYSVETLDRLIVRLVTEELEKLPRGR